MLADSFPSQDGYRMPAEWEPREATWLAWPWNPETWHPQDLHHVELTYLQMIKALCPGEKVNILVNDPEIAERARNLIQHTVTHPENVKCHVIPTDDAWIRDYGPNFLIRERGDLREVAANLWKFDSWGGKYEWAKDARVSRAIMETLDRPWYSPEIVLEGGAIEVNGLGTCLTTEQCLLNPNRNGGMEREKMEIWLRNYLGVRNIIWCQGELEGDDTDGHIDNLVRFVAPDTVVAAWEKDPNDPNYPCLQRNLEILKTARDQDGRPLKVIKRPMPGRVESGGSRLPASYANFYIGKNVVLLPTYQHPHDKLAESILSPFFPDRPIIGIPCNHLVKGLGSIHCVTQQQPAGG